MVFISCSIVLVILVDACLKECVLFKDRQEHLKKFLLYMHAFLQKQQLRYTIFIVEQVRCFQGRCKLYACLLTETTITLHHLQRRTGTLLSGPLYTVCTPSYRNNNYATQSSSLNRYMYVAFRAAVYCMRAFFQKQQLRYTIISVEQVRCFQYRCILYACLLTETTTTLFCENVLKTKWSSQHYTMLCVILTVPCPNENEFSAIFLLHVQYWT